MSAHSDVLKALLPYQRILLPSKGGHGLSNVLQVVAS